MKLDDIIKRADELLELAKKTLETKYVQNGRIYVNAELFGNFRSGSISFINRVFGSDSPHYMEFDSRVKAYSPSYVQIGKGILQTCRDEISGGWLFTAKGLVAAELFSDFISMAEHLLDEGYKDPAAVVCGSVLEEHLRKLCQKHSIPIERPDSKGKLIPVKASEMNDQLAKVSVYSKLDHKNVTAWLDL
jgi:hypothetical protein